MPRPLRIEYENAWYHVMNRGLNRQTIFESNVHINLFYTLLGEIVDKFKIEIHAFCLMNNHYHLLIKTPYANLGKSMKHLDCLYTQRFNRTTNRDGPLFRGRYKAILVDSDQHLLQVSRYIHLNPVTAKLCKNPIDYKWSSYRSFVDDKISPSWLNTTFTLNQMHESSYAAFVCQGIDQETIKFYNKKRLPSIYGSKKFIEKHLNDLDELYASQVLPDINHTKPLPKKDEILNSVMFFFDISQSELFHSVKGKKNLPKMVSIYLLSQLGQYKHKDISEIFCYLKERSITTQIIRLKKLIAENSTIRKHVVDIANVIESKHGR